MSKFSADRCQQLLSLSQPGGHPRIWASSSATALAVVKELVDRVQEENWTIMAKVSVGSQKSSHHNTGECGVVIVCVQQCYLHSNVMCTSMLHVQEVSTTYTLMIGCSWYCIAALYVAENS